jgi:hypothetical protein
MKLQNWENEAILIVEEIAKPDVRLDPKNINCFDWSLRMAWYLRDDPQREKKLSKNIIIVIRHEYLFGSLVDRKMPTDFSVKFRSFMQSKMLGLDKSSNHWLNERPSEEEWVFCG